MFRRIGIAALAATFIGVAGVLLVGSVLSHPVQVKIGDPPPALHAIKISFRSDSGSVIHGWLAVTDSRSPVVLLLPGVRANRLSMVNRAYFLRRAGYSVLLVDLQATGESKGEAITFGWRERLDVLAAVNFIKQELPGAPVAILGSSLGGAAALLATPPLDVRSMILEAVYPTVEKATTNRLRMRLGGLGEVVAPLLLAQLQPRLRVLCRVRFVTVLWRGAASLKLQAR